MKGNESGKAIYSSGLIDLRVGNDFKILMNAASKTVDVYSINKQGKFEEVNPAIDKGMTAKVMLLSDVMRK